MAATTTRSIRSTAWCALLAVLLAAGNTAISWAQAIDAAPAGDSFVPPDAEELEQPRWERRGRDYWRRELGEYRHQAPDDFMSWERGAPIFMRESGPITGGYMFLQGEYVDPPYLLRVDEEKLFVNGQEIRPLPDDSTSQEHRRWSLATRWFFRTREALQNGAIVYLQRGDEAVHIPATITILPRHEAGLTLLRRLAAPNKALPKNASPLPPHVEAWLTDYQPNAVLVAQAKGDVELLQTPAIDEPFEASSLGAWSYVLTVLGMLLAAVAVGQLFVSRTLLTSQVGNDEAEISRAAVRCIMIVTGLSLLDLVWTLVSLRAGVMHELNPIAANFVDSTFALTTFKIGITFAGASVLYVLRMHRPAQLAAWWLCMVCTLVTVRWVAFTSLFVT